jgi:hypothetical protein
MSLNYNVRRIRYYIPYSEPVWPKRRNMVRMFWYWTATWIRNVLLSGPWIRRLFNSTTACSIYLPDSSFWLPTWLAWIPSWAYKREVTPLQRVTTKTTTTTHEIASWFQSFTPPKSTPSRPTTLGGNSLNPWNYFPAHESFVRSLFLAKEFTFKIWSSCPASSNDYEDGCEMNS